MRLYFAQNYIFETDYLMIKSVFFLKLYVCLFNRLFSSEEIIRKNTFNLKTNSHH